MSLERLKIVLDLLDIVFRTFQVFSACVLGAKGKVPEAIHALAHFTLFMRGLPLTDRPVCLWDEGQRT